MQSEFVSLATLQPPNASVTPAYLDFFNSTEWQLVYSIIPPYIFTVCLTGILGNSFVLLVFLFQGSRWSVPEIYLGNLALADLILLVCLPFWAMNILNYFMWSYGEIMCKVVNLSITVNMYTSIYMLVMVNVDRYPRARLDHEGHVAATETLRQVHLCCSVAVRFGNGSSDGCHEKTERYSRSRSRRMLPALSRHDLETRSSSAAEPGGLRSAVPGHHILLHQYHPGFEATERLRLLGGQKRQEGYGPGVRRHPALPHLLGSVSLRNFARLTLWSKGFGWEWVVSLSKHRKPVFCVPCVLKQLPESAAVCLLRKLFQEESQQHL